MLLPACNICSHLARKCNSYTYRVNNKLYDKDECAHLLDV